MKKLLEIKRMYLIQDKSLTVALLRLISDFEIKNVEIEDAVKHHRASLTNEELSLVILAQNVLSQELVDIATSKLTSEITEST